MSIEILTHKSILKAMYKGKLLSREEAKRIDANISQNSQFPIHPLAAIAKSLPEHQVTGERMTLDTLSEWFAAELGLEYFQIDPLKIDISGERSAGFVLEIQFRKSFEKRYRNRFCQSE